MIEFSQLYLFLGATLALLLVPGPAVLYITARSANQGRLAGLVSVLAIETANFLQAVAATLGLSAILLSSALAFVDPDSLAPKLSAVWIIFCNSYCSTVRSALRLLYRYASNQAFH